MERIQFDYKHIGSRGIMIEPWGVMVEKRRTEQKNQEIQDDKYSNTTMQQPKGDTDRIYLPRQKGVQGLIGRQCEVGSE